MWYARKQKSLSRAWLAQECERQLVPELIRSNVVLSYIAVLLI